jgi:tetratricopeptide (TPR) repeat protein
MSGRDRPRRFHDAWRAALASAFAAALAGLAPAAAQPRPDAAARTQIGGATGASRCHRAIEMGIVSDDALHQCTRAIEQERLVRADLIAAYNNRGVMHLRRGEGGQALADFDAAIGIDPQVGEAHLNRGAALMMVGRPGPAVAAITEALSLGVAEPHKAYFNRAAARERLGDVRGAYEDYSAALQIRPNWPPAEAELERFVRSGRDRMEQAMRAAERQEQEAEGDGYN